MFEHVVPQLVPMFGKVARHIGGGELLEEGRDPGLTSSSLGFLTGSAVSPAHAPSPTSSWTP